MVMAYEHPELDTLSRGPRNVATDHLVDWKLLVHAYGFLGITECLCSFAMGFWYLERSGVPFSALWLKYGELDPEGTLTSEFVTKKVEEASSVYFVTLVVM